MYLRSNAVRVDCSTSRNIEALVDLEIGTRETPNSSMDIPHGTWRPSRRKVPLEQYGTRRRTLSADDKVGELDGTDLT